MVDDIKLSCALENYTAWKEHCKGKIRRPYWKVFEDDGDVKTEEDDGSFEGISDNKIKWRDDKNKNYRYSTIIHYTGFETYRMEVLETLKEYYHTGERVITYFLTINGSIKANHFGGTNWERFKFRDLQEQILLLESLGLDAHKVKIENLAPSVPIELPFKVLPFLDESLISYRGEAFKKYDPDRNGKVIGYYCPLRQLNIKLYDKSLQFNLPNNLMQFEDSFFKMQRLKEKHDIIYLSDLKDPGKVDSLLSILLNTWDDVLLFDNSIDVTRSELNERQKEMVKYGDNHKYWSKKRDTLTPSTYGNRIAEFRSLSGRFGNNFHRIVRDMIEDEWGILMESWIKLPGVRNQKLDKVTGTVGGNIIQQSKMEVNGKGELINISDRLVNDTLPMFDKNENISERGLINPKPRKSKKELARDRRERDQEVYDSFMSRLSETLERIAA